MPEATVSRADLTEAEKPGPSCHDCGHLIGVHAHEAGCMDSMTGGTLGRDRLGFCPCRVTSLTLVKALYASTLTEAIDAAHHERRQAWDSGRSQETLTLAQHWGATAGWLASRVRGFEKTGEPDWPDAMRADSHPFIDHARCVADQDGDCDTVMCACPEPCPGYAQQGCGHFGLLCDECAPANCPDCLTDYRDSGFEVSR